MTTAVPVPSQTATGWVAPTESTILTGVQTDWNAAFGGGLVTSATNSAGQITVSTSAMVGDAYDQMVLLFNSMDPAYAFGRMQDAIGRYYFMTRQAAASTVLQVTVSGLTNAPVLAGALVKGSDGNLYQCTVATTIGASGSVTTSFAAVVAGATPVPGSVAVYQAYFGWNSVTLVSGVVGSNVETKTAFEQRRASSVAINAMGYNGSVLASVLAIPGVIDAYVIDNPTNAPATIGGITIAANSLFVCVAGGTSSAIGSAILQKKAPGIPMQGNTTVTVYDTNSGYSTPYPSYSITYEIPTSEAICFAVTIKNSAQVPSNALALIQGVINTAFLGEDGGERARIGSEIFASRFYAGIASLGTWAQIVSVQIGTNATPTASFTGAIAGTALTVSAVTGTIATGQFVYGAGVASGTTIVSGSGTSWVVSVNQTVTSEAMTSVAAVNNDVTMTIAQVPTFALADVSLVLA